MDTFRSLFTRCSGSQNGQSTRVEATSPPASIVFKPLSVVPPQTDGVREAPPSEKVPLAEGGKEQGRQVKAFSCQCHPPLPGARGKNLIVCIDGTANQFSIKNTNVVELYSRLEKDSYQLTYYDSGIGTYVKDSRLSPSYWKQVVSHTIDMMIAWNFKRIVLSAYQWLSENYQEGDRIFLFGFSRGAYQARVIAGMIEKVGLLHKGNNNQIPFAYELYISTTANQKRSDTGRANANGQDMKGKMTLNQKQSKIGRTDANEQDMKGKSTKVGTQEELCGRFKQTLSRPRVRVHFVGAWDTVSSIGVARGPSLPETATGMRHVCVFRHALALDERRCKFLPEYVNGGEGPSNKDSDDRSDVKEVWFVGSHSDIVPNMKLDHFGPALRWMSYEAVHHGLRIQPHRGEWESIPPNPSLTFVWKIIEVLPLRRLSYKDKETTTRR
ncbi:hypothetical protein M422DRAFT_233549, partial [Sphaerobolus stellatus SS14]